MCTYMLISRLVDLGEYFVCAVIMFFVLNVMFVVLNIGLAGVVYAVAFSPNGDQLCSGDVGGNIHIYEVTNWTLVQKLERGTITDTMYMQVTI